MKNLYGCIIYFQNTDTHRANNGHCLINFLVSNLCGNRSFNPTTLSAYKKVKQILKTCKILKVCLTILQTLGVLGLTTYRSLPVNGWSKFRFEYFFTRSLLEMCPFLSWYLARCTGTVESRQDNDKRKTLFDVVVVSMLLTLSRKK